MNTFGNPLELWTKVALTTTQMMVDAAQVIGHRTARMSLIGTPLGLDSRERELMGREKIEAVAESARAIFTRIALLNQQIALLAFKEALAGTTAVMLLATRRISANSMAQQSKLVSDTMATSAVALSRASGAGAQITQQALNPIRVRTSRNVKRLKKRR
ncbi:MAG TPA: hypothetical protein VGQ88_05215 [Burkholderiales bacterium]|nr:hypothetical protein [Burkholderiales bacterium]